MEVIDIIQKAEQMFFNFGIKSISMDDLSREMSISKKTLYTFVDSKDDLVYLVVQNHISREKEKSTVISKKSINAIDEFLQIILHNNDELSSLNKNVIYDLNKYHPKSWNLLTGFTEEYIFNHILQNLKRGVKEELYREDMNPELISFIYINSIDAILKSIHNKKTDKDIATTIKEYAIYHLHGIVSEKGRNYIHNNLKNKDL